LSHGEFFTVPAYADYVRQFWRTGMDDTARAAFTRFLVAADYDPVLQDVMVNETQAYLMFTPDPRIFSPALVGLPAASVGELRGRFLRDMPEGWLKAGAERR
jgi:hypothetical protein